MSHGVMGDPVIWSARRLDEMRHALAQTGDTLDTLLRLSGGQWPDDWSYVVDRRDFAEHVCRFILAFDELRDDFDKLTGSPADLLSDDDEGYVQGDFRTPLRTGTTNKNSAASACRQKRRN